jgi:ubiquinone/menaquinone biosynthesis C-methylase UbiE
VAHAGKDHLGLLDESRCILKGEPQMTAGLQAQQMVQFDPLPIKRRYDALADWMCTTPWYRDDGIHSAIDNLVPSKSKTILELCCGSGALLAFLANKRPECNFFATDLSSRMVELAQAHTSPYKNVKIVLGNWLGCFADRSVKFDTLILKNSLHLIPHLTEMLYQLHSVKSIGGCLVVVETVSPTELVRGFINELFNIIDPGGPKRYFFTESELGNQLIRSGWIPSESSRLKQYIDLGEWLGHKCKDEAGRKRAETFVRSCCKEVREQLEFDTEEGHLPRQMLRLQVVARCVDRERPKGRLSKSEPLDSCAWA